MTDLIRREDALAVVKRNSETCRKNLGRAKKIDDANIWSSLVARCDMIADAIATIPSAPNAGAVKVKPLVWDDDGYGNFRAQSVRGGEGVDRLTEPQVIEDDKVTYEAWGIRDVFDKPEAAQAAVEAEIALEILAAIEPMPDPRDAVIARLVEAMLELRLVVENINGEDYLDRELKRLSLIRIDDILAAAKEVMG